MVDKRSWPLILLALLLGSGCATSPPSTTRDLCRIFVEKDGWYEAASKSQKKWGTPVHIQMAIIERESGFRAKARPPRYRLFGFIPTFRPSDAYGYPQAKDSTWAWYKKSTGSWFADRDEFEDAIDFVGWYTAQSHKQCGISKWDPYHQYLAYHEGQGGYNRGSYRSKKWLLNTARRVESNAKTYGTQLKRCESELQRGGFSLWPF